MNPYSSDLSNFTEESNTIITELTSAESSLKLQVIQKLIEPCDRGTYGQRLKAASEQLNCSVRTVQRLVKKWEEKGLTACVQSGRSDRGAHRIGETWEKFIIASYRKGKRTPAQVAIQVKCPLKSYLSSLNT